MRRALLATIALAIAIFFVGLERMSPPSPVGGDAPPELFSEARARVIQRALTEVSPRPVGSEGDAKARAILQRELERSGFKTEEQASFACGHGSCAYVYNLIAKREGTDPAAAPIMIAAHHDAVPVSFGASDDGVGCAAAVEAARAIAAGPPVRRTVVVVLTDGEEEDLLGAEAFAREHALARSVRGVVNIDARGGGGPSAMFETSNGNAWLLRLLAARLARPVTSSLFFEVYRHMPNDTDFTVWKRFAHGVNLANTSGIEHYHTPLDSLDAADPGTLQHHGDNVLAIARALADSPEVESPPAGDAVWFDVLALGIVSWPEPWTLPIAVLALALVLAHAIRLRAFHDPKRSLLAFLAPPLALTASIGASSLIGVVLSECGAIPVPWVAHPGPALLSLHLAALGGGSAAVSWIVRRAPPASLWAATWLTWAALGVALAAFAPGASYLFVVPALVAGLATPLPRAIACAVPVVVAAVLWLPLAKPIYEALGLLPGALASVSTTMITMAIVPLLVAAPPRALLAPVVLALTVSWGGVLQAPFSAAVPERVNVAFVQEGSAARVSILPSWGREPWGDAPPAMVRALGEHGHAEAVLPWSAPGTTQEAPALDLPAPTIVAGASSTSEGRRHLRVHLLSPRAAPTIVLELPASPTVEVVANGQPVSPYHGIVSLYAVPREGIDVDLTIAGSSPIDLVVRDVTQGLPAGSLAASVAAARPSDATQSQEGDVTVATTRARF